MRLYALWAAVLVAFALMPTRSEAAATVVISPTADLGLPFWCSWGYDWDERCYTDDGPRLPIGGDEDKVWRSALRFALGRIPAGATIESAQLRLWFDGVCLAPRKTTVACGARVYDVDAHRILSSDWRDERELEFDEEIESRATAIAAGAPHELEWDVTALVARWHAGDVPNNGLLFMLGSPAEEFGVSGPYLPSMSFADPLRRPRLVVTFS